MDKVAKGEVDEETPTAQKDDKAEVAEQKPPVDHGVEPPPAEFILDLPNVTAIDLCVFSLIISLDGCLDPLP